MFKGCDSLEYLDISLFNFSIVDSEKIKHIFSCLNNIKYINLSNVSNIDVFKKEISENSTLNTIKKLTICQTDNIINNERADYICLPREIISLTTIQTTTTVQNEAPNNVPKAVPTTVPKAIPTTVPNAVPTTIPEVIPSTTPNAAKGTAYNSVPNTA